MQSNSKKTLQEKQCTKFIENLYSIAPPQYFIDAITNLAFIAAQTDEILNKDLDACHVLIMYLRDLRDSTPQ